MERKYVVIIILIIILFFSVSVENCTNPTTTYYLDDNGNGNCDWGEAVWDEDNNGVYFYK